MTIESMKQLVKHFAPNTGIKQLGYLSDILRRSTARKALITTTKIRGASLLRR